MKLFLVILLNIPLFLLLAQDRYSAFDAIAKGDVNLLAGQFDDHVELCFNGKIQILEKVAASKALKGFLDQNQPKSCTSIHKGASKSNESQYLIGQLTTLTGKQFRVYIYFEEIGGKSIIQELRIDKE